MLSSGNRPSDGAFAAMVWQMNPLHATIEEFAGDGFTHVECHCPRCRMTRLRPISWLPRISMGLTIAQLSERLRCAECGGPVALGQAVANGRRAGEVARAQGIARAEQYNSTV